MVERTKLSSGQILTHHEIVICEGNVCPIHNPTQHHLVNSIQRWNDDGGFMERQKDDGSWTIDPDEYKLRDGRKIIYRNSALCLVCHSEIVSEYTHDFKSCQCGNVIVDGGHSYLRRLYRDGPVVDTSIIYNAGMG